MSVSGLKNADAARGKVLAEAAQRAGFAVHLGIVHIEETGAAELTYYDPYDRYRRGHGDEEEEEDEADEFVVTEVSDSHQYIDQWVDLQDRAVDFGQIPIGDGELFPEGALDDERPDEQRLLEATGNEGASFERSYLRAAIVLWQEPRYAEVLLQAGAPAALPYLRKRIQEWSGQSPSSPERTGSWSQVASLAKRITDAWAIGSRSYQPFLADEKPQGKRAEMLELLGSTRDAGLTGRFIEKVVTPQYDGTENEQLTACSRLLEPSKAGELLSALVQKHMPLLHGACVDLLSRLVSSQSRTPTPEVLAVHRNIAEAAVKALAKIKGREETPPPMDLEGEENLEGKEDWEGDDGWEEEKVTPVEANLIATLLDTLRRLEAVELRDTAAAILIADPEVHAPDTVLVPALSLLHQQHGDQAADGAFIRLWEHAVKFLLARSEFPPPAAHGLGPADKAGL